MKTAERPPILTTSPLYFKLTVRPIIIFQLDMIEIR